MLSLLSGDLLSSSKKQVSLFFNNFNTGQAGISAAAEYSRKG